jgi:hypothetical protein
MTGIDKTIEQVKAEAVPYESWEKIADESLLAFSAFCVFRDMGGGRSIRKAIEITEKDEAAWGKRYHVWRGWAAKYRWRERAAEYDRDNEQLKQEEMRKTIEAEGEMHRKVTGKMLDVVSKKLDTMNPADLSQNNVTEWVQTAIKAEREIAGLASGISKPESKQGELAFVTDFQNL